MKRRKVFGVVAATVANIEQREILSGIYAQARAMDIDIVIMSNIYNPAETADVLKTGDKGMKPILHPFYSVLAISLLFPKLTQGSKNISWTYDRT